jgi:tetratricopeptide (TPR) repeat protein
MTRKRRRILPWEDLAAFSRARQTSIPDKALTPEQIQVVRVSGKKLLIQLTIVALAALLIYVPSLFSRFVFMDHYLLGPFSGQTMEPNFWKDTFFGITLNPLSQAWLKASFAMEVGAFERSPFWFHAVSVSLHIFTCVYFYLLVFQLGRRWLPYEEKQSQPYTIALISSLLLCCHPLLSESVAYIAGRAGVLTACNLFLSLNLLLVGVFAKHWQSALLAYLGCFLAVLMGVQSSPEGIIIPAVMFVLLLLARPDAISFYEWFDETAAHLSVTAILALALPFAARLPFSNPFGNVISMAPLTTSLYVASQFKGLVLYYLRCIVAPFGLSVLPVPFIASGWSELGTIFGVIVYAALCYLTYWWRANKYVCFSMALVVLGFLPSLLVQRFEYGADRRFYISVAGFCLLAGYGLARQLPVRKIPVLAATSVLIVTLTGFTIWREVSWLSDQALWRGTITTNSSEADPRGMLALWAIDSKQKENAEKEATVAIKQDSNCVPALLVLGETSAQKEKWIDSRKLFSQALDLVTHRSLSQYFGFRARLGLAKALIKLNDYKEAHKILLFVLASDPTSADGNLLMGKSLLAMHQPIYALHYLQRGYTKDPNNADYLEPLNQAFVESGDARLIKKAYRPSGIAAKMFPSVQHSLIFAQAALELGNAPECIEEIQKMSKESKKYTLGPKEKAKAIYLYSLAIKELGGTREAEIMKKQALSFDPNVESEMMVTIVAKPAQPPMPNAAMAKPNPKNLRK